ncbi:MAG: hypothetical protein IKH92_08370 [Clostridiales bacterium]|jgi:hypothetical protein|nr:hypothetical protein [Clostridiales bacterium]
MDKTSVSVTFDKEKVDALRIYILQKNSTIDIELQKSMEALYTKFVPNLVREFIKKKEEINTKRKEG